MVHLPQLGEVSGEALKDLKECFLDAYDDNKDGKIEIREVRHVIQFTEKKNRADLD